MKRYRMILFLLTFLWSLPLAATGGDQGGVPPKVPPPADEEKSLEMARDHLKNAMRSLGEAGRLTYESQMPALRDKTDQAFKETQRLLHELEQKLRKKSPPADPPKPGISSAI
ncbi:MAG: hypothetical protein HQM02_03500 [Magnetococcales bacterium]|nr:hypothetical protein [Magnetococcales bacterium]